MRVLLLGGVASLIVMAASTLQAIPSQMPGSVSATSGKAEFLSKCSQCHDAEGIVAKRRSPSEWSALVDRMIGLGAQLDTAERQRVLTYLISNFAGPSTSPMLSGVTSETAVRKSPLHTLSARSAKLDSFVEMPVTGNFALSDSRGQVARLNFLVEEPVGRRLFVGDSAGLLYVLDRSGKQVTPYLNLNGADGFKGVFPKFIAEASFASGLLGFTFDPDYSRNGVFYTIHLEDPSRPGPASPKIGVVPGLRIHDYQTTPGIPTPSGPAALTREAVVVEWTDRNTKNLKFEGEAREVLRVKLLNAIHPMDDLSFNPTAKHGDPEWRVLYIATGDGGTGEQSDVRRLNPQRLDHFGGKIIRIIPDVREHVGTSRLSENGRYRIPSDNPFVAIDGARKEIWATGLRNPHRMAWDGNTLLAFVIGSNAVSPGPRYETIDVIRRGANYGYPLREGPEFKAASPIYGSIPTDNTLPMRVSESRVLDRRMPLQDSALAYRTTVEGHAISNGFVYRGAKWPQLQGAVVFGDITSGRIFYARMADLERATDGDPATLAPFGEIETDLSALVADRMKARKSLASAPAPTERSRPFRVDMRLATDRGGEIYILTKSDGLIRKVVSIS